MKRNRYIYTYYIDLPGIVLLANSAWWWRWMRGRHDQQLSN